MTLSGYFRVPRVVALYDLAAGTELTCHYMIDMEEAGLDPSMQWYLDEWERQAASCEEN